MASKALGEGATITVLIPTVGGRVIVIVDSACGGVPPSPLSSAGTPPLILKKLLDMPINQDTHDSKGTQTVDIEHQEVGPNIPANHKRRATARKSTGGKPPLDGRASQATPGLGAVQPTGHPQGGSSKIRKLRTPPPASRPVSSQGSEEGASPGRGDQEGREGSCSTVQDQDQNHAPVRADSQRACASRKRAREDDDSRRH